MMHISKHKKMITFLWQKFLIKQKLILFLIHKKREILDFLKRFSWQILWIMSVTVSCLAVCFFNWFDIYSPLSGLSASTWKVRIINMLYFICSWKVADMDLVSPLEWGTVLITSHNSQCSSFYWAGTRAVWLIDEGFYLLQIPSFSRHPRYAGHSECS